VLVRKKGSSKKKKEGGKGRVGKKDPKLGTDNHLHQRNGDSLECARRRVWGRQRVSLKNKEGEIK